MSVKHPYPGLRPFQMLESEFFFGRGEQINQMLHRLETHRFLAVVGASGSGKSSLVRAGLLPALRDGFLSGAEGDWRFVVFRPGDAPFGNLADALHRSDPSAGEPRPQDVAMTAATLTASDRELVNAVRDLGISDDVHLLVLIDQFEEIFRYRRLAEKATLRNTQSLYAIRDAATAFVNQLLESARQTERTIYVVLTMRSDFLGDCDAFLGLPEAINDSQFLVPRLTRAQMRSSIVEPLHVVKADAEPALVESLLNDTGSDPDQLPLLQHTLLRLWLMQDGKAGPLTLASYRDPRIGGLQKSLSNHADEAYHALSAEEQRIAEKMFRSLCGMDIEGKWTRRWLKVGEIAALANLKPEQWPSVAPVVEAFVRDDRNFLVVSPEGPIRADTTIDISHEALIRQWGRMQGWLQKEQESIQQYRRLSDTARRWKLGQAGLWGSPDLDVVLQWHDAERPSAEWAKRYGGEFALTEEFLQSSVAARDEQRRDAEERRQAREHAIAEQKLQLETLQKKEAERNELQKTRHGRAQLMLAERAELWNAKPESRRLPTWWEYWNIQTLTRTAHRTDVQKRMMQAANRYHGLQAGMLLAALLLAWWGTHEINGRFQARALRDRLIDAEIAGVPDIVKNMTPYWRWLDSPLKKDYEEAKANNDRRKQLKQDVEDAESSKDRRKQLYAGLARLPHDSSLTADMYEQLLEAHPNEIDVVRQALAPHKAGLVEKLWKVAELRAAKERKHRLRAASALAAYDPNDPRWAKVQDQVVKDMVSEQGVLLYYWAKALYPVLDKLQDPLAAIYRDSARSETERSMAIAVLADYAKNQPNTLANLLVDADATQFTDLFAMLKKHGHHGLASLEAELLKKPEPTSGESGGQVKAARRQANAAVALLRMGKAENVWPLLEHSPDPTVRSYLIHRFSPMEADAAELIKRLDVETDVTIRRALILSLGAYDEKKLPAGEPAVLVEKLKKGDFESDDPGLHAAASWLLKCWNQEPWPASQRKKWADDEPGRLQKLDAIRKAIAREPGAAKPRWYVDGEGHTMVVIPGPRTFTMGSPTTEADRVQTNTENPEIQHRMQIKRSFCIAARAVTVAQYRQMDKDHDVAPKVAPTEDCPVHNVTWFQAAKYCNWLSKREGIPPDQWCFTSDASGNVTGKRALYLKLTGYRLPTEAEFELASRAGARTSRYFGEPEELLTNYCWYQPNAKNRSWPVGSLKPNDLGLFDMLGNVHCWCQEHWTAREDFLPDEDKEDPQLPARQSDSITVRGGSFASTAAVLRCAAPYAEVANSAFRNYGFRVARTFR